MTTLENVVREVCRKLEGSRDPDVCWIVEQLQRDLAAGRVPTSRGGQREEALGLGT
jgi:hypothetical protein